MALKKNNKSIPILFGLGIICLTLSFFSFYVEQRFDTYFIVLSLLGTLSISVFFFSTGKSFQRHFKHSKWKNTVAIFSTVILVSVLYLGINYFAYSLHIRWDVTKTKQHTLTTSTIEFIKDLKNDVKITVFHVGLSPKYLEDMLKEYKRAASGKISFEIIDPIEQIGYAAQFGNIIDVKAKKVIIRSGNELKEIDFTESSLKEEQLTNAIIRVTRKERHIYFLTGHREFSISDEGDQGLSIFKKLLSSNNITSENLMLGIVENIPSDCDVLIIAGPRNHLTQKEETMIEKYLKTGGDALFLIEHLIVTTPDKPLTEEEKDKNPSLNNILNQWGINVEKDIVVDLNSHAGKDVGSPATKNYMRHKAITHGLDYTFYVRPRSISVLNNKRSSIKLAPIVLTATKENSWAETNRTLAIHFDKTVDRPGPVPIQWHSLKKKSYSLKEAIHFSLSILNVSLYYSHFYCGFIFSFFPTVFRFE